jgi:hypothetical protein
LGGLAAITNGGAISESAKKMNIFSAVSDLLLNSCIKKQENIQAWQKMTAN